MLTHSVMFQIWVLVFSLLSVGVLHAQTLQAGNLDATPVDQRAIFDNSCGPVCIYNSLIFGKEPWQSVAKSLSGETPKNKIVWLTRVYGRKISSRVAGIFRWSITQGISVEDLTDVFNDLIKNTSQPPVSYSRHFQKAEQTNTQLLVEVHSRLRSSLEKGLPPILNLQRYALRNRSYWTKLQGHFVTVLEIPEKLSADATSFEIRYLDPWGGRLLTGKLTAPSEKFAPPVKGGAVFDIKAGPAAVIAVFPHTSVGKRALRKGEHSRLIALGVVGL